MASPGLPGLPRGWGRQEVGWTWYRGDMTDLPMPAPLPTPAPIGAGRPERADLEAAFQGVPSGWYTAQSLLPRYNAWAEQEGKEAVTAKTLGDALWRKLDLERRRAHGNVTAWFLP